MLNGPRATVKRARQLRREMSLPEVLLWRELRARPGGHKFRRQHPAGRYVLDFFCAEARLAIEIDGQSHDHGSRPAFDTGRDAWLEANDIVVLRFPARDILDNLEGVVRHIIERAGGPDNPPRNGEGDRP